MFNLQKKYTHRLKAIRATLECSDFFTSHEVIGSSLLFVHDQNQARIWLIDFAKTVGLPDHVNIDHNSAWSVGNHEDGYLIGINNLIRIFEELQEAADDDDRLRCEAEADGNDRCGNDENDNNDDNDDCGDGDDNGDHDDDDDDHQRKSTTERLKNMSLP